ncbi:uncharacterized protein BDW47DRAFT_115612 [Aspergillus candidus]|uniref:Uncharacterized protein n=1 Tax=Aspergillus candidus TaxID=41067 RepID=A0A2I2FK70_ASPCN|nr:hypothetical protein BDW47DRAFT_115612 [Aspergillus candidus]PLB41026.1 hypothetical protein BDW47DRAFT_115612 [Aspergillus candidus]
MADMHRPKTTHELYDETRDFGPRLLSLENDYEDFLPISKLHPEPPLETDTVPEDFVRPPGASHTLSDTWLPPPDPDEGQLVQDIDDPTHNQVAEAVERAVMNATPRTPLPLVEAKREQDLLKSLIGSFPAASQVRLMQDPTNPERLMLTQDGTAYIYRGRGPVFRNNSCAVDCVIAVGKMLDVGSTVMDRQMPHWHEKLGRVEKAFIEATDVNWDVCTVTQSIEMRDRFWEVAAAEQPAIVVGNNGPLWSVWKAAAGSFPQFRYTVEEERSCQGSLCPFKETDMQQKSSVILSGRAQRRKEKTVPMPELLPRHFSRETREACPRCHRMDSLLVRKRFSSLPARMVVTVDGSISTKRHTGDIEIMYTDLNGVEKTAVYRWLGGIYCQTDHFRVYWTDTNRGEEDKGGVRLYDSLMNLGLVVGGIRRLNRLEKVPKAWWKDKAIPLLIYELVPNPTREVLVTARRTVSEMLEHQRQGRPILKHHNPWASTNDPETVPRPVFWNRILPLDVPYYYQSHGGYQPMGMSDANFIAAATLARSMSFSRGMSQGSEGMQGILSSPNGQLNSGVPGLNPQMGGNMTGFTPPGIPPFGFSPAMGGLLPNASTGMTPLAGMLNLNGTNPNGTANNNNNTDNNANNNTGANNAMSYIANSNTNGMMNNAGMATGFSPLLGNMAGWTPPHGMPPMFNTGGTTGLSPLMNATGLSPLVNAHGYSPYISPYFSPNFNPPFTPGMLGGAHTFSPGFFNSVISPFGSPLPGVAGNGNGNANSPGNANPGNGNNQDNANNQGDANEPANTKGQENTSSQASRNGKNAAAPAANPSPNTMNMMGGLNPNMMGGFSPNMMNYFSPGTMQGFNPGVMPGFSPQPPVNMMTPSAFNTNTINPQLLSLNPNQQPNIFDYALAGQSPPRNGNGNFDPIYGNRDPAAELTDLLDDTATVYEDAMDTEMQLDDNAPASPQSWTQDPGPGGVGAMPQFVGAAETEDSDSGPEGQVPTPRSMTRSMTRKRRVEEVYVPDGDEHGSDSSVVEQPVRKRPVRKAAKKKRVP